MKKTVCAGVFALAALGLLSAIPTTRAGEMVGASQQMQSASINIGRIRSVLRLTPEQARYWAPVEAALRDVARRQAQPEPAGLVRRISHRVISVVLDSAAVERLAVVARPLIRVLDDEQKQAAGHLAQEMGLGPVVMAALN